MSLRLIAMALTPVLGLGVAIIAHVAVSRAAARVARHHALLVSAIAGAAAVGAIRAGSLADDLTRMPAVDAWLSLLGAVLAYVLLAWSYVFGFFNIGESARRIRLVIELEAAGARGLTLVEVLATYDARAIVDARLVRLVAGGQLVARNGRYVIGRRLMLGIAKLLVVGKIVLFGRPTEAEARQAMATPLPFTAAGADAEPRVERVGHVVDLAVGAVSAAVAAFLAVRFFVHAGPLWRDEIDPVNLSKLPFAALWELLDRISTPPAYPALLGLVSTIGGANEDLLLRLTGLATAIAILAALWLSGRAVAWQPPALAIALVGTNAIAVHTAGSVTVYASGMVAVIATFGAVWTLVAAPRLATFLGATIAAVVAVQLQYQNLLHVAAIVAAGAVVSAARRQWPATALVIATGVMAAVSLLPFEAAMTRSMPWRMLSRNPLAPSNPLTAMSEVLSAGSPAMLVVWLVVLLAAVVGLARMVRQDAATGAVRYRALYATVTIALALAGVLLAFGLAGPVAMPRHLMAAVALLALGVDVLIGLAWSRWVRVAAVGAVLLAAVPVSLERTAQRATSVDLVARHLEAAARPGDLIVVSPWFVTLTFDRYYHGAVPRIPVPPLPAFRHHDYTLVRERMMAREPLAPLHEAIARTLDAGGRIWFVGGLHFLPAGQRPPVLPPAPGTESQWFDVPYLVTWSMQTADFVRQHALRWAIVKVDAGQPVNALENPSVMLVEGSARRSAAGTR